MACGCQKKAALRAANPGPRTQAGTPTRIFFYAVPPPEDHEHSEMKFRTLRDARSMAKANKGWIVQQRRETLPVEPPQSDEPMGPLTASSID